MGSLAGEIQNPGRNYPIVIGILIPTTVLYAAYPLMVALSLNDDRGVYTAGYFQTSATELTGPWLGIGFVVGACFSFVGTYVGEVIVCERSVAVLAEKWLAKANRKARFTGRSRVLRYLLTENGTGVAPLYISFVRMSLSAAPC